MERRKPLIVAVALMAALVLVLPLGGLALGGDHKVFETELTGAEEAPGPGDTNATGFGRAKIPRVNSNSRLCFKLNWADIDGTVTMAHIHRGAVGVAGPVVVTLFMENMPGTGDAQGCIRGVDSALNKEIRQTPTNFYFNIHSTAFPPGAIRGQLGD
jgi:CHRD domain